ncbi:kinase-like domain-containing protein [Mycena floridula]|nr:kinase-like domain-containing protein [Mycena floridula]
MHLFKRIAGQHTILPPSFMIDVERQGRDPVCRSGGYSDLYKGKGRTVDGLGQVLALKVLRHFTVDPHKKSEELWRDFCREALIWKQLSHPNLLPFLGANLSHFYPSLALVSPWMANGDIMEYLKRNPKHDRWLIIKEVAAAMLYLHEYSPCVVHADIRGANILMKDDLHCCLADFGLTCLEETHTIASASSMGSRGATRWLGPEVLIPEGHLKPHPSRDVYAYASTLLEIFTGKIPYHYFPQDITASMHTIAGKHPKRPAIEECSQPLPDDLWELMQKCWEKDPVLRPSTRSIVEQQSQIIAANSNSVNIALSPPTKLLPNNNSIPDPASILNNSAPRPEPPILDESQVKQKRYVRPWPVRETIVGFVVSKEADPIARHRVPVSFNSLISEQQFSSTGTKAPITKPFQPWSAVLTSRSTIAPPHMNKVTAGSEATKPTSPQVIHFKKKEQADTLKGNRHWSQQNEMMAHMARSMPDHSYIKEVFEPDIALTEPVTEKDYRS